MVFIRLVLLILLVPVWVPAVQEKTGTSSVEPNLTEEEMKKFLLTAEIVHSKQTKKGVTRPYQLTLTDGILTHDAGFQPVNIDHPFEKLQDGTTEIGFRDTYRFNLAAYQLAKLLGLGHMMPVTVERQWNSKTGSMTWWLKTRPEAMDETERFLKKIHPPDIEAWNRQMYRKRVFAELVYDKDPNATNVLIGEDWKLYMIDFTRAFRTYETLPSPKNLERCDRELLEKLRKLDKDEVLRATKPYLSEYEIKPMLKRRDKIVAHYEKLIKEKGEEAVLY